MTKSEILICRLIEIGYEQKQAIDLVGMYEQRAKLAQLEDYISIKENLRGEAYGEAN